MLKVSEIGFQRHETWLWNHISFELNPGQLLQITGANGSGKTTLLRVLTGLAQPHAGHIFWQDQSITKAKALYQQQLHYLSHQSAVKSELSVEENLRLNIGGDIHSLSIEKALEWVGLAAHRKHFAYQISQGQKQRLALARLLLSKPPLWILDEPLAGLDVEMTHQCQNWFTNHLDQGGMIILTSHQPLNLESIAAFKLHLS